MKGNDGWKVVKEAGITSPAWHFKHNGVLVVAIEGHYKKEQVKAMLKTVEIIHAYSLNEGVRVASRIQEFFK